METALYIASFLGAVAVYLALPRREVSLAKLGALVGAATLGGLWLYLGRLLPMENLVGGAYYYVFSAIALGSAMRVITHTRPVYSALWFVMVVLATAGLLVLAEATFMAFALLIIYGGAILVTYLFVIMLAAPAGEEEGGLLEHDRVAFEPAAAVSCGFFLLAVLLQAIFRPLHLSPAPAAASPVEVAVGSAAGNIGRLGVDLFQRHPLGLELAGLLLLVSLVGAVVLTRLRVPQDNRKAGSPSESTVVQQDGRSDGGS